MQKSIQSKLEISAGSRDQNCTMMKEPLRSLSCVFLKQLVKQKMGGEVIFKEKMSRKVKFRVS